MRRPIGLTPLNIAAVVGAAAVLSCASGAWAIGRQPAPAAKAATAPAASADAIPWPESAVVPPKALVARIKSAGPPTVIQISYDLLFKEGHVPGALHAGPGESPEGLAAVKKLVKGLPRDREIVLYCGCCPYKECANLLPVYKLMREMGFTRLEVLELENDFFVDWTRQGYPIEKGMKTGSKGSKR